MNILSEFIHRVYDDAYPAVRTIINDLKGIAHEVVEEVKDKAVAAAEHLEDIAEGINERVDERVEENDGLPPWGRITAEILDARAAQRELEEKTSYDWRRSPVDLLKLVGIDSSFSNRQELAKLFDMPAYKGSEREGEQLLNNIKAWLGV